MYLSENLSKMAWAVDTKIGKHILILYSSRSACTRPEVKKSRSHSYESHHGRTVANEMCCCGYVLLLPAWDCTSYDCV